MKSRRDYPKQARRNAQTAIRRNKRLGNKCATQVGKVRARQISKGKPLTQETLRRTYSYLSRAQAYHNPADPDSCGSISFNLWGGTPMLRYTRKVLGKT